MYNLQVINLTLRVEIMTTTFLIEILIKPKSVLTVSFSHIHLSVSICVSGFSDTPAWLCLYLVRFQHTCTRPQVTGGYISSEQKLHFFLWLKVGKSKRKIDAIKLNPSFIRKTQNKENPSNTTVKNFFGICPSEKALRIRNKHANTWSEVISRL